jgi:hypothetical protein
MHASRLSSFFHILNLFYLKSRRYLSMAKVNVTTSPSVYLMERTLWFLLSSFAGGGKQKKQQFSHNQTMGRETAAKPSDYT